MTAAVAERANALVSGRWEPFEREPSGTNAQTWYRWSVCGGLGAPMVDTHAPGCRWVALQGALTEGAEDA